MALLDFQTAMGRMIRAGNAVNPLHGLDLADEERACLQNLPDCAGFRFTVEIQRSWCIGRASKSAHLTLSLLSEDVRRLLLEEWTSSGAGVQSFHGAEADAFLDFIASRLPDPSHELTVCRLEQAALRAGEGADRFTPPDLIRLEVSERLLRRGRYAGLTRFYTDPTGLLETARRQEPLPAVGPVALTLLFGPGVDALCRAASPDEVDLWERLNAPKAIAVLLNAGYRREMLEALLSAGLVEYASVP